MKIIAISIYRRRRCGSLFPSCCCWWWCVVLLLLLSKVFLLVVTPHHHLLPPPDACVVVGWLVGWFGCVCVCGGCCCCAFSFDDFAACLMNAASSLAGVARSGIGWLVRLFVRSLVVTRVLPGTRFIRTLVSTRALADARPSNTAHQFLLPFLVSRGCVLVFCFFFVCSPLACLCVRVCLHATVHLPPRHIVGVARANPVFDGAPH